MRKMVYVPMIHSPQNYQAGSKQYGDQLSNIGLQLTQGKTGKFWDTVQTALQGRDLGSVRLYMESNTNPTMEVAPGDLKDFSSPLPEHAAMTKILEGGGSLEQTEDPVLIADSINKFMEMGRLYAIMGAMVPGGGDDTKISAEDRATVAEDLAELYKEVQVTSDNRDKYIADKINETLKDGETGVLMIGDSHDVISKLPKDITTELLDERLPEVIDEFKQGLMRELQASTEGSVGPNPNGGSELKG